MSTASRLRNPKRPTQNSSTRHRLFGAISKPAPFNLTGFQKLAHESNKADPKRHAKGGAFGGVTTCRRLHRVRMAALAANGGAQ